MKLLLIVIDSLSSRTLREGMEAGRLPRFAALAAAGTLRPECVTVFPSITPAAAASIVTGCYPAEHGIAGAFWYDASSGQVAYYGDDIHVLLRLGVKRFLTDFLVRLNRDRLRADTLFQAVERAGLRAASLNYLVFRGNTRHSLRMPWLWRLWPGVPRTLEVEGPSLIALGDLVQDCHRDLPERPLWRGGLRHHFGWEDHATAELLITIAKRRALPECTVAYFLGYDARTHKEGAASGAAELRAIDDCLQELFAIWGGCEAMLSEVSVVITADHGQSNILEKDGAIQVNQVLTGFSIARAGEPWRAGEQLMICPNMRSAQLYFRTPAPQPAQRAITQLLSEDRIDQVIWNARLTDPQARGCRVATRDRGDLHFWLAAPGEASAADRHGARWSWRGDLRAVDGQESEQVLSFGDYPNAFERITCGLAGQQSGHVWATARLGYEFSVAGTGVHRSSHGSLQRLDSLVPLLLAGMPADFELPESPMRTVDVAPLCLSLLGLPASRTLGESHACLGGSQLP